MRDPYAGMAEVYDSMARDPGIRASYRRWREALSDAVEERGLRPRVLVDLACGTGNSTLPWCRRGWTVAGVDRSAAMLREARRKSKAVRWYRQELTELAIEERADLVTCHFDALNHVLEERDLQRIIVNVATVLRPGGLFQFDLNTVHWLRFLSGKTKLFRAGRHYFTAYNEFDAKRGIATFHQLWFINRGRRYERRLVTVRERAYADTAIRAMLQRAGLRLARVTTDVTIEGKPARKLYLAANT